MNEDEIRKKIENARKFVPGLADQLAQVTVDFIKKNFSGNHFLGEVLHVIISSHISSMLYMMDILDDITSKESKKKIIMLKKRIIKIFSQLGEIKKSHENI